MKTMLSMLLLAMSLVAACSRGSGDSAERVFADMSANMREMSAILASVTDEASAKAAVPRIEAVREKMRDCARRAKAVPRPDATDERRINEAALAIQREIMPSIIEARQRIAAQPPLLDILAPALQGMENDL